MGLQMRIQMQRQFSCNVGCDGVDKKGKPTIRRSSSVDLSSALTPCFEISSKAKESNFADYDSGTEDLSQNELAADFVADSSYEPDEGISNTNSVLGESDDYQNQSPQVFSPVEAKSEMDQLVEIAKMIKDCDKQMFCESTKEVFHAEFWINFVYILNKVYPELNYVLLPLPDGFLTGHVGGCWLSIAENAKAQFKCPSCARSWTSMRARITFDIGDPNMIPAVVYMKIYEQACETCHILVSPFWYMDEVCRVMRNFSNKALSLLIPNYVPETTHHDSYDGSQAIRRRNRSLIHSDPNQRKGSMSSPHKQQSCQACQLGICFESVL